MTKGTHSLTFLNWTGFRVFPANFPAMANDQGRVTSPWGQGILFFVVFLVIAVVLQLALGATFSAGLVLGQVIVAAIAAILFVLLMRWFKKRS
jgi:multisubunit Na+/H+ antiporter MnhB subunit